jgi:hypothetical protein
VELAKATGRANAASHFNAVLGTGRGCKREVVVFSSSSLPLTQFERADALSGEFSVRHEDNPPDKTGLRQARASVSGGHLLDYLELVQVALGALDQPPRWVMTLEPAKIDSTGLQARGELAIADGEWLSAALVLALDGHISVLKGTSFIFAPGLAMNGPLTFEPNGDDIVLTISVEQGDDVKLRCSRRIVWVLAGYVAEHRQRQGWR